VKNLVELATGKRSTVSELKFRERLKYLNIPIITQKENQSSSIQQIIVTFTAS
jgi:hypothetical protein